MSLKITKYPKNNVEIHKSKKKKEKYPQKLMIIL